MLEAFRQRLLIRVSHDRVSIRDVVRGSIVGGRAALATSDDPDKPRIILAVGDDAMNTALGRQVRVWPVFPDPETLIADARIGALVLQHFVRGLHPGRLFHPPVRTAVLHLPDCRAGIDEARRNYASAEIQSLVRILDDSVMCPRLAIWEGPNLSDEQVRTLALPDNGIVHYRRDK